MNARSFIVSLLACCYGASLGQGAQSPDVSLVPLAGVVQSTTRVPLRDVHIELKRLSDGNTVATRTNAAGLFKIEVAEGEYQITATFRSQKVAKEMNVAMGKNWVNLSLNVQPRRVGPSAISIARLGIPEAAHAAFKKARDALVNQDPVAAARHLEQAIERYPRYVEALTVRSMLARDVNPRRALADAQQAIEYDPNYGESYVALASAYTALGRFDDAIRMLDRGIVISPTFWLGYYEMSRALLCKRDYAVALGYLEIASALAPKSYPFLHIAKADAFEGLRNNTAATRELEGYLREAPQGEQVSEARQKLRVLESQ